MAKWTEYATLGELPRLPLDDERAFVRSTEKHFVGKDGAWVPIEVPPPAMVGPWVTLSELRKGAIFETRDGIRAVTSEYSYSNGAIECVLLDSGEYAHFAQHVPDRHESAVVHNATIVREVIVG